MIDKLQSGVSMDTSNTARWILVVLVVAFMTSLAVHMGSVQVVVTSDTAAHDIDHHDGTEHSADAIGYQCASNGQCSLTAIPAALPALIAIGNLNTGTAVDELGVNRSQSPLPPPPKSA